MRVEKEIELAVGAKIQNFIITIKALMLLPQGGSLAFLIGTAKFTWANVETTKRVVWRPFVRENVPYLL